MIRTSCYNIGEYYNNNNNIPNNIILPTFSILSPIYV